jgi:hypothetical protein
LVTIGLRIRSNAIVWQQVSQVEKNSQPHDHLPFEYDTSWLSFSPRNVAFSSFTVTRSGC